MRRGWTRGRKDVLWCRERIGTQETDIVAAGLGERDGHWLFKEGIYD